MGLDVYVIGDPLGLSGTVTKGIISAIRTSNQGIAYIQVAAATNPGSSGGPLINSSGRVLGVITFKAKGFEGLNFAISASEVLNSFGALLK